MRLNDAGHGLGKKKTCDFFFLIFETSFLDSVLKNQKLQLKIYFRPRKNIKPNSEPNGDGGSILNLLNDALEREMNK